tara:strand:- start:458 stop:1015 length:558 start_codon:yes stop_codon:yes gene_type:complete
MQHFLYIGVGEYQLNVNDDNSNDYWVKDIREKWKDKNWTIWACDPRHYSDYDAVESSNWIDHFINEDVCDDWKDVPLFDEWNCTSVLEHVKKDRTTDFIQGLRNKVTESSKGYIHIDFSNHNLKHDGSTYYDKRDKKYKVYLNRIGRNEWMDIIGSCFSYSRLESFHFYSTLHNVVPKVIDKPDE